MITIPHLVAVSAIAAAVGACIPHYVAPAPAGALPRRSREAQVVGEPQKVTLKHLLDRLGDCAPLWCSQDSVPGRTRCVCLTSPPTVLQQRS